ncbi:MAG: flagellar motor switch protein FliG [Oscillospiraceae bacterium]|jgi:flagellar motor switch protein FliG|nr:flagellar motor switch protein FliG [Oscillospiraceae bacterium]
MAAAAAPTAITELSGREKAAILLIALGKEYSAMIFKHFKDEEIEQLTLDITNVRRVDTQMKEDIIEEFYEECLAQNFITEGGIDYARDLLEKAIGPDRAMQLLSKLTSSLQVRPFDFARKSDPNMLLNLLQNEHPQTIALVLSYLEPVMAAGILAKLTDDKQTEVVARISTMDRTNPEYVREIERILDKKLSSLGTDDFTTVGGIESIVEILNSIDRGTERRVLEELEIDHADLVDEIRRKMFVFEDIVKLDKRAVQRVLKDVENSDLTVALKSANDDVKTLVFENMSKRMADMIREDMEYMGPVRVKDVEEAQQRIVNVIRKLQDSGDIVISRGNEDEMIV